MRLHRWFTIAMACGACCAIAELACASLPDAVNCVVPPVINACPAGDIAYTVIVLKTDETPVNASQVVLDFSGCPGVHFCAAGPTTKYVYLTPTSVAVTSDVTGSATFWLEAGGACTTGIQITASEAGQPTLPVLLTDGYAHAPVSFASVDQDGDLVVTPADAAILAGKSATDPTADLNGDGTHNAADAALLTAHLGHVCASLPTPTNHKTWGQIKLIYR